MRNYSFISLQKEFEDNKIPRYMQDILMNHLCLSKGEKPDTYLIYNSKHATAKTIYWRYLKLKSWVEKHGGIFIMPSENDIDIDGIKQLAKENMNRYSVINKTLDEWILSEFEDAKKQSINDGYIWGNEYCGKRDKFYEVRFYFPTYHPYKPLFQYIGYYKGHV